jgi:hypothetical protein
MKLKLLVLILFFSLNSIDGSAQDTVKKFQTPARFTKRLTVKKTVSPHESIAAAIRLRLDSLANFRKGTVLRTSTVRTEIESILYPYWAGQTLLGSNRSQAYLIQTGLQTMTQLDIQNGRLLVTVGLALNEPAEFVLLHFEQIVRTKKLIID